MVRQALIGLVCNLLFGLFKLFGMGLTPVRPESNDQSLKANNIPNPNLIYPGQVLYIPTIEPTKTCTVTSANGLNARTVPTSKSTLINSFSPGTVLSYFEVVNGENVAGNPLWGHSDQGYYFWLGGTDHPNG